MLYNMYFLSFILYCFIGWFYESTICSLPKYHKIINRGFLLGPYCPIYGVGVMANWFLLKGMESPVAIFLASALISCAIEYVTSYGMEKLFYAKWWDYSDLPFNLHGRICLYGGVIFGGGNVIFIKVIHPFVMSVLEYIPKARIDILALVFAVILLTDIVLTVNSINNLNKKLKTIHETINGKFDNTMEIISDKFTMPEDNMIVEKGKNIIIKVQNANSLIKAKELRIMKAFPDIKFLRYGAITDKIYKKTASYKAEKQDIGVYEGLSMEVEVLILEFLEKKESYGYEIARELGNDKKASDTYVYKILKSLLKDGKVTCRSEVYNGRSRRYYSLTGKGKEVLTELRCSIEARK